jgi:hypothetical protein
MRWARLAQSPGYYYGNKVTENQTFVDTVMNLRDSEKTRDLSNYLSEKTRDFLSNYLLLKKDFSIL